MIPILLLLFIAPLNVYGIACWCQKGPSTYQTFVDNGESWSSYTNCYLTGNNPSSDTCYDATCPGGDWVLGNAYAYGETELTATDGDDCISQCSALGSGYNIANMDATCGTTNSGYYYYYDDDFLNDDDSTSCTNWFCSSSQLGDGTCDYWCSGADCNYDNGDCNERCDYSNECSLDNVGDGECGVFAQATDKWCEFDGVLVCCSDDPDFSDCCEPNPTIISITVVGIFLFVAITSIWAWRRKRRDNTKDDPPKCCYKLWCPVCSVITHQGCESKMDICMAYICCSFFSVCCWSPKAVVVADNDNEPTNVNIQSGVNLEIPNATVVSNYDLEKF